MRKLIGAINMTIDGFCDHTALIPDEEIHDHYTELITNADMLLYGRTTYQLMEFWREILKNPTGHPHMDKFAVAMDRAPKLVFSRTLQQLTWKSASLARQGLQEEVQQLKQQPGNAILVGSRSLIVSLLRLRLIDELQLCVHPVIAGSGLPLFDEIGDRTTLMLVKTKTFNAGAITLYYSAQKS